MLELLLQCFYSILVHYNVDIISHNARYETEKVVPGPFYRYKGCNPDDNFNYFVDILKYHVDTLPQFQDIVDESGRKGKFGGWLSVCMNLVECPAICLVQYNAIFKQYIFNRNISIHKGRFQLDSVPDSYEEQEF